MEEGLARVRLEARREPERFEHALDHALAS